VSKVLKLAISSLGDELQSFSSLDFSGAPYFIVYDLGKNEHECIANKYLGTQGSVGIKVAQLLLDKGVRVVISDGFDPWVYQFFKFHGVELFKTLPLRISEVIEKFKRGDLKRWELEPSGFFKSFFTYFHFPFGWFWGWGGPFDWRSMRIAQLEAMINALEAQLELLRRELDNLKRGE